MKVRTELSRVEQRSQACADCVKLVCVQRERPNPVSIPSYVRSKFPAPSDPSATPRSVKMSAVFSVITTSLPTCAMNACSASKSAIPKVSRLATWLALESKPIASSWP